MKGRIVLEGVKSVMWLDWDKMQKEYFSDRHYHVGYYKNGYDIEAAAWKRKDTGAWDVFFDDRYYDISNNPLQEEDIFIFKYDKPDLNYEEINIMFEEWVVNVLFNGAKDKSKYKYKESAPVLLCNWFILPLVNLLNRLLYCRK